MAQFTVTQLTAMLAERRQQAAVAAKEEKKEAKLVSRWMTKCQEAGVTNIEGMSSVQLKEACNAARAATKLAAKAAIKATKLAEKEAAKAASENDVYSGQIESVGHTLSKNVSRFRV